MIVYSGSNPASSPAPGRQSNVRMKRLCQAKLVDDADADAMLGLRAAEQVLDEQRVLLREFGEEILL